MLENRRSALREERKRIASYIPRLPKGDLTLVVLKGHLMVEEVLYEIVAADCYDKKHLEKARLSFWQLAQLAPALAHRNTDPTSWFGILELNALRNAIAHNLEPRDIEVKVDAFWNAVRIENPEDEASQATAPTWGRVGYAISYVLGRLSAVSTFNYLNRELDAFQRPNEPREPSSSANSSDSTPSSIEISDSPRFAESQPPPIPKTED